jgi:hypothetical protein
MPSYIELDKQGSFPPSSNIGKLIFGVNTSGDATLTNVNGVTSVIGGGGGTGIQIPQPIVLITGATDASPSTGISIQFADTGFDFTQGNPEIFLFRWKNGGSKTYRISQFAGQPKRKRFSRWVHPTTEGSEVKWEGWKFFNGNQYYNGAFQQITGRTTEWLIPPTIKPYEKFGIDFNKYMFWNLTSGGTKYFDINVFSSLLFTPTDHQSEIGFINIGM